jgi:hypothetical protein
VQEILLGRFDKAKTTRAIKKLYQEKGGDRFLVGFAGLLRLFGGSINQFSVSN